MLPLNLFHEQIQIQREKDLDPIRWTIVIGALVVTFILIWAVGIYVKMGDLRASNGELSSKQSELEKKFTGLGALTDLAKIQEQAQALHDRIEFRPLLATQLDIFRDAVPTNCQIRIFRTMREMRITETITPAPKNAKNPAPIVTRKKNLAMDLTFEIETRTKGKGEALEVHDSLVEILRQEARFKDWVKQVPGKAGDTNMWNNIMDENQNVQDSKGGGMVVGIFAFRMPLALKDQPKDQ